MNTTRGGNHVCPKNVIAQLIKLTETFIYNIHDSKLLEKSFSGL